MGIGANPASGGATYQMNGGTLTASADFSINESKNQTVTFNQSGGTVDLDSSANHLRIVGRSGTGGGIYNISGGTLSTMAGSDFVVGGVNSGANGTLNVSGTAFVDIGK